MISENAVCYWSELLKGLLTYLLKTYKPSAPSLLERVILVK